MAADTSSSAAASTAVVGVAAAVLADVIDDPIPANCCDAEARTSGEAITNDDTCDSHH